MITVLVISAILATLMRSTDAGKPLHSLNEFLYYHCPKRIRKGLFECKECRSLWLSVITLFTMCIYTGSWYMIWYIPLVFIFTYTGYRLLQ